MRARSLLSVGVLVLGWQVTAGTTPPADGMVGAAEAAARAGAESPGGKKFGETVGAAFGGEHGSTVSRCAKETGRPEMTDFDLFLRVGAAGSVDEVLVKPSTNLAECVRAKLKGWKVGAPPHEGFWVTVAVKLKRK